MARAASRRSSQLSLAALLLGVCICNGSADAQGVQAVRGTAAEVAAGSRDERDSLLIRIAQRRTLYQLALSNADSSVDGSTKNALEAAIDAAQDAIDVRNEPKAFRRAISRLDSADRRVTKGAQANRGSFAMPSLSENSELAAVAIPQVGTLVPEVVFVVGFEATRVRQEGGEWASSVGASTNLLGEAIAAATDAIGSSALSGYFKNNTSAGVTVPTTGHHKLGSQVGLGLGGFDVGRWVVWPTITFDQRDTTDSRLPDTLTKKGKQSDWSYPSFAIAIPFRRSSDIAPRIRAGRIVPIVTLAYTLPYYFAGDTFTALAALFTNRQSQFERIGKGSFSVGVSIPLLKVSPDTTSKE